MIPKKVFYVPGLISLIGLPILLLLFGPEDKVEYTSINLNLPSKEIDTNNTLYTESYVFDEVKKRNILEINLSENPYIMLDENDEDFFNNRQFRFIQNEMERLQFIHDTTTVLKVGFGEESNYGEFVWLINQALIYRFQRYSFVDNNLYFFANPPPIPYSNKEIEPLYVDDNLVSLYQPPTKWEIFRRNFQHQLYNIIFMLKYNWLLSIGFLLLIFIPAVIQIFRRKNRAYN